MKQFFCLLALLCLKSVYAQIHYEKGYFINNSNVRTSCYIKNVDWRSNPTAFEYKINSDDSNSTVADVGTVREFAINGESKYRRFQVNIEKSETILSNLTKNKNPVWQQQTLFLKVLVEGEATLYSYTENNITKFFYTSQTVPIEQLVRIMYRTEDDGVNTNNMFRQQLYNNVRNENTPNTTFQNINYDADGLIRHFRKFNNDKGSLSDTSSKNKKKLLKLKLTAGIGNGRLIIHDPVTINEPEHVMTQTVFHFGAEVEYVLPFNKNKWSLFLNPYYQTFQGERNYTRSDGLIPPHFTDHIVEADFKGLSVPVGVRHYLFLNDHSKLSISAMYSINFQSGMVKYDRGNVRNLAVDPGPNFVFGFGYTYKDRFGIEARRVFPRDVLVDYPQWLAQYSTLELVISFRIL